ncbi:hypothetical protein BAUCODRAFT_148171 [Baudoinia panamericana UAMH 10762]|uniref:SCP domain-containing protein n=1 Tax=Baudoinia panamericana (strain UAMH 10762) TaxID=717646 RepID=M2MIU9_BAUPA|nr:uncharacterized protein BAUCODRAFT_148171 [Baudoinia panamericana UAMH 10762]EMC96586.1 hypothetical protein BAUCODRAFT_148171 [Baudoinia panamericana UAMH 10762]
MHTAILAAAFVATALAVPYHNHHQRDVVYDYNTITVTDVVYVTASGSAPSSSATSDAADSSAATSSSTAAYRGFHQSRYSRSRAGVTTTTSTSSVQATTSSSTIDVPTSTLVAETTSSAQAPTTSSTQAPTTSSTPAPTTSSTPAPTTSSTQAPSSTQTPSSTQAPTTTASPSTTQQPSSTSTSTTSQAPTTSIAASSSTQAAASSVPSLASDSYQDVAVYHHNIHRVNHSAPNIVWDTGLANTAAIIASSCNYSHNTDVNGGGYGQNIAAGVNAENISLIITELFYNGEVNWFDGLYNVAQPNMTNFEHWGHFSQIVWKSTTSIGCATQMCSNLINFGTDSSFTVCNYGPPGNFANEYGDNIGTPLNNPTASWNTGGLPASGATGSN